MNDIVDITGDDLEKETREIEYDYEKSPCNYPVDEDD